MKIGITGSTGVLGRHLLKKLKQKKYRVVVFNYDIQEVSKVKKWVKKNKNMMRWAVSPYLLAISNL